MWHCSVGAAPGDRVLSAEEWGEAAVAVMDLIGFARHDDESGVRGLRYGMLRITSI